jgi:hydroxymethylbilane synthase
MTNFVPYRSASIMIKIGSRGSDLALWQAHYCQNQLKELGLESEIIIIKTQGDKIQHLTFDKLEGKGFFTKELEDQLLDESIDMAVHSMKDLPTTPVEGLTIAAVSSRADARDVLLFNPDFDYKSISELNQKSFRVGTSSARRKSQLLHLFPNCTCLDIRGNVPTRINKLASGEFDAIVLAKAGIDRLELDVTALRPFVLDPAEMVPAPAQGVLAYQTLTDNIELRKQLRALHNKEVAYCTNIERGVLNALDGGCQLPLGVHVYRDHSGNYVSFTAYASPSHGLCQFRLTQSTFDGLKDAILEKIHSFSQS